MNQVKIGCFRRLSLLLIAGASLSGYSQQLTISPKPLYLGQIPVGQDQVREVVLRNTSSTTLIISNFAIEGTDGSSFSTIENPGTLTIGPYARYELSIRFNPQSGGDKNAELVLTSNAGSSPDRVGLFGGGASIKSGIVTFERILGTLENDGDGCVRKTPDGGFIISGHTDNVDEEASDAYLMKTDAYGHVEWTQIYDSDDNDDNSDRFSSVIPVFDGYIAVGSTYNGKKKLDLWIVKTDLSGNFVWDKLYSGSDDDAATVIERTNDGNFIIAGNTKSVSTQNGRDGYLIKIDGQGNEIFSRTIGGTGGENFNSVKQTSDGGYIVAGTISSGSQETDMYLVKTDAGGNLTWDEQYGGTGDQDVEEANSVIIAPDGGYILAGWTSNPSYSAGAKDIYIIKTNSAGVQDMSWGNKTFGEAHHDEAAEIINTSDGGFLVAGSLENHYEPPPLNEWYSDLYIIKLDQSGNKVWDKVYGGIRREGASCVRELTDGSFIVSGGTVTYGSNGDSDIYLVKVNSNGEVTDLSRDQDLRIPVQFNVLQNFPNPFNNQTRIDFCLPKITNVKVTIYDITGKLIKVLLSETKTNGYHSVYFDAGDLASGLYFYQVAAGDFIKTRRMLLIK